MKTTGEWELDFGSGRGIKLLDTWTQEEIGPKKLVPTELVTS